MLESCMQHMLHLVNKRSHYNYILYITLGDLCATHVTYFRVVSCIFAAWTKICGSKEAGESARVPVPIHLRKHCSFLVCSCADLHDD